MPSRIPEIGPLRAPQGFHLLLSVGIPALFWTLAVYWASGQGPAWPLTPLALVYSVLLGLWSPWRQRTRQGPMLKLWIWVVATLALYAGLALAEGQPWPATFRFEGLHLLWFLPAFLQGQLTALWAGQLTSRGRLYQLIEGIPSGRELEQRVRDFQLDADFSRGNETTLSASLVVLALFAVGAASFSPFGQGFLSACLAGGFLVVCVVVGVLLRVYRREMETLMYGRRLSLAEKLAPLAWSLLLVALALGASAGLMALGGPWVDWSQLLQGRHDPVPALEEDSDVTEPPPPEARDGDYRFAVLVALLQHIFRFRNIVLVMEFLIRSLIWCVPLAIAAFLLWPLVKWLLSSGRETRGLVKGWWKLLKAQWKAFLASLLGWWGSPLAAEPSQGAASHAREWVRSLFRSPSRRAPYPEVVEAFLRLVAWAEPVAAYRQGETTREFLDRLAERLPSRQPALSQVRELLDQELFAAQGLDTAGRWLFLSLVRGVTDTPASHDDPSALS